MATLIVTASPAYNALAQAFVIAEDLSAFDLDVTVRGYSCTVADIDGVPAILFAGPSDVIDRVFGNLVSLYGQSLEINFG